MTMVDEAMALMSDGGTWTITPEKQGAADRFIARLREADAAQKRIAELTRENDELRARDIEANDACVRMEKRIAELSAKCDAAMGALDEMCDALGIPTDGRADGPSANAALAQARKGGFREGVEAAAATVGRLTSHGGPLEGAIRDLLPTPRRRGRTMASDLLAAAKAVLARYDHDQSPYVADDALAKRMREVVMADLRAAVEEAERASPPKRETPAEHFRACGPFCAHVQHCPKCANVHGFCGGHATPDDAIRWADPKGGES